VDISKLKHSRRWVVLVLTVSVVATVALLVAGTVSAKSKKKAAPLVAVLWPENVTPRWEQSDNKVFIKSIKKLVPGVKVLSQNANASPATQQSQAEGALAKGAKVLVVAAVDGKAFATTVDKAWKQHVPVIAYDRLIYSKHLAYYASFDSVQVGKVEAGWMAQHVTKTGAHIAIINGSPTDANAHFVKKGIHAVYDPLLKSGKAVLVGEQWGGWDPVLAQSETEQILTQQNNDVDAVISANDGMAGGIIAALKGQKLEGKVPTTGQDASPEGLQNILRGYQGVSAFKDFRLQAPAAAKIAAAILNGKKAPGINGTILAKGKKVPAWYGPVVPITKGNMSLLVKNGWIASQVKGGLATVCAGMPKTGICA
jgi:D-xylose transport system substrate-binding protein